MFSFDFLAGSRISPFYCWHVNGTRQIINYRVQNRLDSDSFKKRSEEYRENPAFYHCFSQTLSQFLNRYFLTSQIFFQKPFVFCSDSLNQFFPPLLGFFFQVLGNFFLFHRFPLSPFELQSLHFKEIYDAGKTVFLADGQLHRESVLGQSFPDRF